MRIYTVSVARLSMLTAFGFMMSALLAFATQAPGRLFLGALGAAASIYFFVWGRSVAVEILPDGVRYRSLHTNRTVFWHLVSELRFACVNTTVDLVPADRG